MTVSADAATTGAIDQQTLVDWLLGQVGFYLEIAAEKIDPNGKLVEYGLDSVYALSLCGDIEDEYGIEIEPTLAWDYPTVNAIAGFLTTRLGERG
jgi:acyl carrier protein